MSRSMCLSIFHSLSTWSSECVKERSARPRRLLFRRDRTHAQANVKGSGHPTQQTQRCKSGAGQLGEKASEGFLNRVGKTKGRAGSANTAAGENPERGL